MSDLTVNTVSIADEEISPRYFLEHEGEVLSAHGGLLGLQTIGAKHVPDHLLYEVGFARVVDGWGVVSVEVKLTLSLMGRTQVLRELSHSGLDHVEHSR